MATMAYAAVALALDAGAGPLSAQEAPLAATAAPKPATSAANINITPRRLIFDRNKRADAVYVFNQGNAPVTVDVALIDNVMLPSGEILPVARAAEKGPEAVAIAATVHSAVPLLIAAPSRLTLPPGQGRAIRIRASLPDTSDVAEYRTHLTVTSVPSPDTGLTAEQAANPGGGELVMRVQALFGVSIPLIVRTAVADATASFGTITESQDGNTPTLEVPVRRQGATSLYGNIEVRTDRSTTGEVIGLVRGLGVYPEVSERHVRIPLSRSLHKGETVKVTYFSEAGKPGSAFASGTFTAP